MITQIN